MNGPPPFVVSAPSGLETTEVGGSVTFTVRLAYAPTSPVRVALTSSDPTEAVVSPATLELTGADFATERTVTVTGVLDAVRDGDVPFEVRIGPAQSDDPSFSGRAAAPIALTNAERLAATYTEYDVNHILSTGQSNAVGEESFTVLSTGQPYGNLMFDRGVMTILPSSCNDAQCNAREVPGGFLPLREGDRYYGNDQAAGRETLSSGMANQISKLALEHFFVGTPLDAHDSLVSIHARSGTNYLCLRAAGCTWHPGEVKAFDEGMLQVSEAKALAASQGKSYVVRGVTTVHGEDDHYLPQFLPTATYAAALIEWQHDYETRVQALTGQEEPVPLFVMQLSGWKNDKKYSLVSEDQYNAHLLAPGKVVLVAPAYMLTYAGTGCLHYTSASQRRMGEYFAKAYAQTVFGRSPWEPLRPREITRAGRVLTVRYRVPVPPLAFDTMAVSNPGNYGFAYTNAQDMPQAVEAVTITGPDTVQITLAADPGGAGFLRYAEASDYAACPRPGSRGNLRDSDPTPSQSGGQPLRNWGVGFRLAVP